MKDGTRSAPGGTSQPLPAGTLTLLFTDIEGSTELLQRLGNQYANVLARQRDLLRVSFANWNGHEVDTQGDAFFAVFSRAVDAVNAAVAAQRALNSEAWPEHSQVKVRMALHTGEPQLTDTGYVGIDVHRAARICAAGHGGQVLLSQTTTDLVDSELPEGVTLRDLGEHRLKDLRRPKRIFQLDIAGLPADFPPLQTLNTLPNNLPLELTSFIGREQEMREVKQLLSNSRLLTLTGPGGSGKTRLALQVAAESIEQFRDGVFFVPLAPLTEPALVAFAIAQVLGVDERAGQSVPDSLKLYLQSRQLLLFLDNFEQVISAAPLVVQLLAACNRLTVLVTSREGLHVRGEHEYPVPPLALPNLAHLPPLETLVQSPSVSLFIQRARAIKPDFELSEETAFAVAEICCRLDGLPLAIELAAARIKVLPPRAMLARLKNQLEFLTGGPRDLPARQQTLRSAIAWSYDLLNAKEKEFFRRLSVFVGSITLDAARAVTQNAEEEEQAQDSVLDQLSSLLDKSLLREIQDANGEPYYTMLEMLREFGGEKLAASGELEEIRRRHAWFFLALAEASAEGTEQVQWMNHLEQENGNLRAALEWSRNAEGASELCLRLAAALGSFWEVRGYYTEGRERLSAVLSMEAAQGQTPARARLLAEAAELAYRQSDYPATISLASESLAICRQVGDKQGIASALIKLANAATESGDFMTVPAFLEEALATWRALGDKHGTARALMNLGWAAMRVGDYQAAKTRLEETLVLSRELGDTRGTGFALSGLGEVAVRQGEYDRATQFVEASLDVRRQIENKWGIGASLGTLGWIAMRQGDWPRAVVRLGESLAIRREIGDKGGSAWCLERLAEIAVAQGQPEKGARLYGAASALRESIGSAIDPVDQPEYEKNLAGLRAQLSPEQFASAWTEGRALTMNQAIEYGLDQVKSEK